MRTIDIHAHLMPQCFWNAVAGGGDWYGDQTTIPNWLELLRRRTGIERV